MAKTCKNGHRWGNWNKILKRWQKKASSNTKRVKICLPGKRK